MTKKPPDRDRSALRERCLQHFAILRIPITSEELDQVLDQAEQEAWAPLVFVDRLLGEQAARRRERSTERRITAARFPERKALETFDWNFNGRFIDRVQIEQLATGDFVRRRRNLILIGQSGVGKSYLGQVIGLRLCALGYRVLYTTSAQMIRHLGASLAVLAQEVTDRISPALREESVPLRSGAEYLYLHNQDYDDDQEAS